MGSCYLQYKKPDHQYHNAQSCIQHVVEFVHSCFCIIEGQCQRPPFSECFYLVKKQKAFVVVGVGGFWLLSLNPMIKLTLFISDLAIKNNNRG